MPDGVYLIDGARTPQGRYGGVLASVRPDDLAALVVGEAVRRSAVPADAVDEVILGAANQSGEDNRNVARMAVLLVGLPDTVPGYTVNRLCASGLTAVASAAQAVRAGRGRPGGGGRCRVHDPCPVGHGQARHAVGEAGPGARHLTGPTVHQPAVHRGRRIRGARLRARNGEGDLVHGHDRAEPYSVSRATVYSVLGRARDVA
jgi:hypothetical protein